VIVVVIHQWTVRIHDDRELCYSGDLGTTGSPMTTPGEGTARTWDRTAFEATARTGSGMSDHLGSNRLSLIPSNTNTDSADSSTEMARWTTDDLDSPSLPTVLRSLDDDHCRAILSLLDSPKSASELCEECGLSSSTVYRKLELLRESGLVREYTEVRRDGPNVTLYERDFSEITIGVDEDGEFTMAIARPETDGEDRLATFWSAMKEES
jgi:DNA-binding transcriptional ArsR family regulator